ncbi:MAG: methyltransferase domain-containing protein [Sheuella sp.]|nr:methyltransferase domain-containing protein [Sheuella sp.]
MSTLNTLPISTANVARQFSRRADLADAQFLYGEIARRMDDRLRLIRLQPTTLLDAGCGAGQQFPLLHARYPQANYIGQDHNPDLLAYAKTRLRSFMPGALRSWLNKQRGIEAAARFIQSDLSQTGLAPESLDLVWSNLALHWHPAPHDVLAEWGRILKLNGLVFFSCFGPATMQELRTALTTAGLQTMTPSFVDMHDFGDLLIEKGFADPVMDQEILTFTYTSPEKLLEDVRALGGNPATGRRAGLVGKSWRERLLRALESARRPDGNIHLTIEVAYGHAWRTGTLRSAPGETKISVSAIQRKSAG